MITDEISIKETSLDDLENIAALWNTGDVMKYVGFSNGLGVSVENLKLKWLPGINKNEKRKHYSIYHHELGYCGESYYEVEENGKAALDIKLFSKARGKGIAFRGLKHAIDEAFIIGNASVVYVDPQKRNDKALKLYSKFSFKEYPHPDIKQAEKHCYFELSREDYFNKN